MAHGERVANRWKINPFHGAVAGSMAAVAWLDHLAYGSSDVDRDTFLAAKTTLIFSSIMCASLKNNPSWTRLGVRMAQHYICLHIATTYLNTAPGLGVTMLAYRKASQLMNLR